MNYGATGAPTFRSVVLQPTLEGFELTPQKPASDLWIEAIVWVVAAIALVAGFLLGGTVLRVLCAIGMVGVGARAVRRVVSALLGGATRTLRVMLRIPRPALAGPFATVALDEVDHFMVGVRTGLSGVIAVKRSGQEQWVIDFDPGNTPDYEALAAWLNASFLRQRS